MLTRYLGLPSILLELTWAAAAAGDSSSYSIPSNATSSSIPASTSTLEITSFVTVTDPAVTGNGSPYANQTGLEYARSCNRQKQEWIENRGSTYVSNTTFTTSTYSNNFTIIRTGWIETHGDTALYTLCDGYPRMSASTEFKTSETTSDSTIWSTFSTQTEVYRSAPAPTCSFGARECSALRQEYNSNSLAWSTWYYDNSNAPYIASATEPVCGRPTVPPQVNTTLNPAACVYDHATVQLLYWPVSTVGDHAYGTDWSTVEATQTIPGQPNTAHGFNTVFTSPTVYMVLSGAYENGPDYSTGSAINGILPIASDRVSSMCDYGGRMGPPEAMDYADFQTPHPAEKYRCQPACWTKPDWPQSYLNTAYNVTATENLCSTIYDGVYKPALQVPLEEFNSFYGNYTNGVGLEFDGLQCSFRPATDGIFYDPPIALQQVQSAPGPTMPGSPGSPGKTTTKDEEPKTTPPSPGPTVPTTLPQTTGANGGGSPQPTRPNEPGPSGGSGGNNGGENNGDDENSGSDGKGGASNAGDRSDDTIEGGSNNDDDPGNPDPPSNPTGTQNIGALIASIIGVTREEADPAPAEQTSSPQDPGEAASDQQEASDPSGSSDGPNSNGNPPANNEGSDSGSGQAVSGRSGRDGQGVIRTGSSGQELTAMHSGDNLVLPSTTIFLAAGQETSISGLGSLSAASDGDGIVQDGQTVSYQPLTPSASSDEEEEEDIYSVNGRLYTAEPSGNIVVAPDMTITAGGPAATASGTTFSLASGGGWGQELVVNGVTATRGSVGGSGEGGSETASGGLPQQTRNAAARADAAGMVGLSLSVALVLGCGIAL